MPQSTELILEVTWETVRRLALEHLDATPLAELEKLGWTAADVAFVEGDGAGDPQEHRLSMMQLAGAHVDGRLAEAHLELCRRRWPDAELSRDGGFKKIVATTPEGTRELSAFSLENYGYEDDPYEYVGVGMTARYFPTWTDWRETHGGSGHFRLDRETMAMIQEAREAIAPVIPEIRDAPCTAAPNFY